MTTSVDHPSPPPGPDDKGGFVAPARSGTARRAGRLPPAIWVLGLVSLFMDVSSEMIHGLLPAYLVGTVGLSVAMVGLLDGVAEATALGVKVFSGAISDALGRRKILAVIGYGLAALCKPLFAVGDVAVVITARVVDRFGKGIRGAPRDALVADLAPSAMRGAAFGLRQSLDSVGALLGPLLAIALMMALDDDVRTVFLIAAIPGGLSVLLLAAFVREPPRSDAATQRPLQWPLRTAELRRLPSSYWSVVAVGAALMAARFSEGFLVLRAQHQGLALTLVPLVLVGLNIVYAASAWPAGRLADRVSRPTLLAVALAVLLVSQLVFTFDGPGPVAVGVALWGLHLGLSQGVISAMVADTAPSSLRGTAFGVFHLVSGVATLLSSTVAGVAWEVSGPVTTFFFGAAMTTLTLVGLLVVRRRSAVRPDGGAPTSTS